MSLSRAVARGTTQLLGGLLAAKAMDFALYLVLARRLGVEEFGRYMFAFSFTLLFNIVADVGLSTVFTREASRAPERIRVLLGDTLVLKLALGAITIAATAAVSIATGAPARTILLVGLFTLAMLMNSSSLLFEGLLKSAGRAGIAGLSLVAQSATALAVGLALVLGGAGALGGACAYAAAAFVHVAAAAFASRGLWRADRARATVRGNTSARNTTSARSTTSARGTVASRGTMPASRTAPAPGTARASRTAAASRVPGSAWARRLALLRESAPLAISGVFIALYFRVDSVMLHAIQGERAVGLYGGIYRFFEGFVLLSAAYRSVLFPVMARAADGPREALGVLCRKSLRLHLIFTVGVATFFSFEARPIITLVLGEAYAAAAPGLTVLIWALPGAYMADTLLHLLTAQRRQSDGARVAVVVALFNLGLNAVLIPRFSFVGASAATVASEALCFVLLFAAFRRGVPAVGLARTAWRPLAAGAVLAGVLALALPRLPGGPAALPLAGAVALGAYATALALLKAFGREDWEVALALLPARLRRRPAATPPRPASSP
ncbi:MAG: flippase [Candidatus Eisenbacteria bacterium]|nr:flippase [Candidatus Eisenbacteria bacterium]